MGKERGVRLKDKALTEKAKHSLVKLMKKFRLDELEVEILLKAEDGETPKEIAKKLGELLMPVEARMMRSISAKFGVATFKEARERFKMALLNKYMPEEDQFIIKNCKKMTYAEMASHIGRPSTDSVRQRIEILQRLGKLKRLRLGFVKNGVFHRYYLEEEDETIKKLYPSLGKKFLAKQLNRSEDSIQYRVSTKLKVKKAPPAYLNASGTARLLKVGQRTICGWIYQGFLKASKSGRRAGPQQEWRIESQDLSDFMRDYYYIYDPNRIEDEFLKSIIAFTPAGKAVPGCQAIKVLGIPKSTLTKRLRKGQISGYKGFGPRGHTRWYVQLDKFTFDRSLTEQKP